MLGLKMLLDHMLGDSMKSVSVIDVIEVKTCEDKEEDVKGDKLKITPKSFEGFHHAPKGEDGIQG